MSAADLLASSTLERIDPLAVRYRGVWDAARQYNSADLVLDVAGRAYVCHAAISRAESPVSSAAWRALGGAADSSIAALGMITSDRALSRSDCGRTWAVYGASRITLPAEHAEGDIVCVCNVGDDDCSVYQSLSSSITVAPASQLLVAFVNGAWRPRVWHGQAASFTSSDNRIVVSSVEDPDGLTVWDASSTLAATVDGDLGTAWNPNPITDSPRTYRATYTFATPRIFQSATFYLSPAGDTVHLPTSIRVLDADGGLLSEVTDLATNSTVEGGRFKVICDAAVVVYTGSVSVEFVKQSHYQVYVAEAEFYGRPPSTRKE